MKLSLQRGDFLLQLQTVARATATRSSIQALAGVLVSTQDNQVELAATDTEIGLRSRAACLVQSPGSTLIPGRLLVEILRVIASDEITIDHRVDQGQVEITSAQTRFALKALSSEDFPRLPPAPAEDALRVSASTFARTIDRVARAASRDETRPVLTGILVSVNEGQLRMVATDSYRLSVKETPIEDGASEQFEVNVPARALQELSRVIADVEDDQVVIAASNNQIVFSIGDVTLSSRMIEGQFPNYRQLLPESYEHEIRVEQGEFLGLVRRISLMAQRNAPLRLKFENGSVTASAQTPDVGEATETIPVNYNGEPLEIGFNAQFLQDGLDAVEADELVLKLISPLRPGLIEAAGSGNDRDEGKFLYLIMPVRLNV